MEKSKVRKKINRQIKTVKRGLQKRQAELEEALNWEKKHHEALLIQSNLYRLTPGVSELVCEDWETGKEVTFFIGKDVHKELHKRFKQARKARLGVEPLTAQVAKFQGKVEALEQMLLELEEIETEEELEHFCQEHHFLPQVVKRDKPPRKPYKEYCSATGIRIWVGRSAKDNDEMTFRHANGLDWWLHVRDYSGSHVIIKTREEPDYETLEDAIQLAIAHSRADGKNEVSITQCKHVKAIKGVHGRVSISKHRNVLRDVDPERLKRIIKPLPLP